jgi:dihydropyrimidinase
LTGCPLYVVHVSCREALEPIRRAREHRWPVWAETCTQYLMIDRTALDQPGFEGAKYVYTPPPRDAVNHQPLWDALADDVLSAVGSDHAPFRFADQKRLGGDNFLHIPNGAPGIEDRLPLVHHFGVRGGRITLHRMVELLAANPARLFGLYPRKGWIGVGADADIVLFDPACRRTITASQHHSRCDYNLYEGTEVVGWPVTTIVRGQVIVDDGRLIAEPGAGCFVPCAPFDATRTLRGAPL